MTTEIKVNIPVMITDGVISDIMVTALEGGINYWCTKAEVVGGKYLGEFASDQIALGGSLKLYIEDEEPEILTKEKFIQGLQKYLSVEPRPLYCDGGSSNYQEVDAGAIDGSGADYIIQLALFGELVYD